MSAKVVASLALLLLASASVPQAEEDASVVTGAGLAADDECAADADPEACALNAVQLRKARVEEVEGGAATWYLGHPGDTCTAVCKSHRMTCSASDLNQVKDWQQLFDVAMKAGAQCKYSWANDGHHGAGFYNVPSICTLSTCGVDSQGTCAYDKSPQASCDGTPATGFSRICPCVAGGSSSWSSPSPSPASSSSLSPSPTQGTCKADTGGTCKLLGCAKSRGAGVTCSKKAGYKCECKPGYCANKKGVCEKASSTYSR